MATDTPQAAVARHLRIPPQHVREVSASLAISVIWLAVLLDALFGPDIVSSGPGANTTTVPSAVILAVFAYLATRVVAKHGLGSPRD